LSVNSIGMPSLPTFALTSIFRGGGGGTLERLPIVADGSPTNFIAIFKYTELQLLASLGLSKIFHRINTDAEIFSLRLVLSITPPPHTSSINHCESGKIILFPSRVEWNRGRKGILK
jgi:hypothetical protein